MCRLLKSFHLSSSDNIRLLFIARLPQASTFGRLDFHRPGPLQEGFHQTERLFAAIDLSCNYCQVVCIGVLRLDCLKFVLFNWYPRACLVRGGTPISNGYGVRLTLPKAGTFGENTVSKNEGSLGEKPNFGSKLGGIGWECYFWSFSQRFKSRGLQQQQQQQNRRKWQKWSICRWNWNKKQLPVGGEYKQYGSLGESD